MVLRGFNDDVLRKPPTREQEEDNKKFRFVKQIWDYVEIETKKPAGPSWIWRPASRSYIMDKTEKVWDSDKKDFKETEVNKAFRVDDWNYIVEINEFVNTKTGEVGGVDWEFDESKGVWVRLTVEDMEWVTLEYSLESGLKKI